MAVLTKRTASAVFTDADARAAVAQLTEAEGLPSPIDVRMTSDAKGVLVRVADRDAVDEWAEMLNAVAVRDGNLYGAGWQWQKRIQFPGRPVLLTVHCIVPAIKWQPRIQFANNHWHLDQARSATGTPQVEPEASATQPMPATFGEPHPTAKALAVACPKCNGLAPEHRRGCADRTLTTPPAWDEQGYEIRYDLNAQAGGER